MKRALITGITGYIGSNLAYGLLENGYEVYGLIRRPLHMEYIGRIKENLHLLVYDGNYQSVLDAVKIAKPNVIYHLAACYAVDHDPAQIVDIDRCNLLFGNYILEAMRDVNITNIVYSSSVFCHFNNEEYNPLNFYAATKKAFSDIMRYYTEACGIRSLTLVLTDSYGPHDHRPKVLNMIKRAYRENKPIGLSSGTQVYDVLYIDDIVKALKQSGNLLEKQEKKSTIYQIYNENALTLKETVELMEKIVNVQIDTRWGTQPKAQRRIDDKVRVYPLLPDWNVQVPLEEGLAKFWLDDKTSK